MASNSDQSDYIFYGGDIITMDENYPTGEALAVKGDKIIAIGKIEDIFKTKGENTQVINLNKQTLLPGLIEPHQHAFQATTFRSLAVDISGYYHTAYEDIRTVILRVIRELKSHESWAIFSGWDAELIPDLPTLNAEFIESNFTSDFPILIIAQNYHIAWANMKAFEMVGVHEDTENPRFGRDESGKLTGQIYETVYGILIMKAFLSSSVKDLTEALKEQWNEYTTAGITTSTELGWDPVYRTLYDLAVKEAKRDDCPIRLGVYHLVGPEMPLPLTKDQVPSSLVSDHADLFFWDAGVKIIADGSPHCGTMAVTEPFLKNDLTKSLGFPDDSRCGVLNYSSDQLLDMVKFHHKAGKQIAIHTHGERACNQVLDAYEQVLLKDENHRKDCRHRMEHIGLITEEQVQRASKMNLALSFFVNHLYFYGRMFNDCILGPERTKRWAPCSLGTKYNLCWSLHQDQPAHPGPPKPFSSMKTAITRTERSNPDRVYGPEYRVTVHEALKAYTINAAWQLHMEKWIGSLTVGKQADLLIVSDNPYKVEPMNLDKIEIIETFVAGRRNNLSLLEEQKFAESNAFVLKKNAF